VGEPVEEAAKSIGIFSNLEKATEVATFLLLTAFALMLDCASLHTHGVNILHLSQIPQLIGPQLAVEALLTFLAFCFLLILLCRCFLCV
jgi:hypothetical protein